MATKMFTQVEKMILHNKVDFILHTPGNYKGGILEMTMIIDCEMEPSEQKEFVQEIIGILKSQNQIFRNVRLNLINWKDNADMKQEVISMSVLQIGNYFDHAQTIHEKKEPAYLFEKLKVFHARSKLVIVLSHNEPEILDKEKALKELNPFLKKKILWITPKKIYQGSEIMQLCMH